MKKNMVLIITTLIFAIILSGCPADADNGIPKDSANGLPDKWTGIWDCWGDNFLSNAQLSEQWRTSQEGYMVLTSHDIGFFFNIDELMTEISILEAVEYSDGSYDVLTHSWDSLWSELNSEDTYVYRKLRFMEGTTGYKDELWIIMCIFDPDDPWSTTTEDLNVAKAGDNFVFNREEWNDNMDWMEFYNDLREKYGYGKDWYPATNYTLFVSKRP